MKTRNTYSNDFLKQIVQLFDSKQRTVLKLEHVYDIGNALIYKWIKDLSSNPNIIGKSARQKQLEVDNKLLKK